MDPLEIFFCVVILVVGGVWAIITNRRWVLAVIYSVAVPTSFIVFAKADATMVDTSFGLKMIGFLFFGVFADIFLYRINNSNQFSGRILWGLLASVVLALIFLLSSLQFQFISSMISPAIIYCLPVFVFLFFICMLVTYYIGLFFAKLLKHFLPNMFEGIQ